MSGGNCPETPRQKMIGMMYLMLTAMLALNVSGDLLNAFDLVDKSIKSSTRNVEAKNAVAYSNFESANAQNPAKVGEAYKMVMDVKKHADELYNYIDSLKNYVVFRADGPEFDQNNYQSKSNQDIAATIFMVESNGARGQELRDKIGQYKDYLKGLLPEEKMLCDALESMLATKDTVDEDGVTVPWQSQTFEHIPLAASMALLSNMQGSVRNAEADVVQNLYGSIDKASFKFNKIEPLIIAKSNYVLQGASYEADIMLAAYDDTMEPVVTVGGSQLTVEAGRGKYTVPASSVGNKNYTADLSIPDPVSGEMLHYKVEGEYEVAQPMVTVSPIKMNAMYRGLDNPLEITAPGISQSDLKVSATGCTLTRSGSTYIAKPAKDSKKAVITVSADVNGKSVRFPQKEFRVYSVPKPTPSLPGAKGTRIAKNQLSITKGPKAELEDFVFDVKFEVVSFTLTTKSGGFDVSKETKGASFSAEQKQLLSKLNRGQKFWIEDIKVKFPDGSVQPLGTISMVCD
ncbi:MAG: gliding motility protein GldM [Marinilabiliaceae bacterium]|nr:gliding motility protein GldM [Marinilabiliaceae bacterium]